MLYLGTRGIISSRIIPPCVICRRPRERHALGANAMDHQSIETTRRSYAEDTIEERAAVTALSGANFESTAQMLARRS